jgi:hypothetical protein
MGNYLSCPRTEKLSEDGDNGVLKYGASSMQGWRSSMEDAVKDPTFVCCSKNYSLWIFYCKEIITVWKIEERS